MRTKKTTMNHGLEMTEVEVAMLVVHPLNRKFMQSGDVWEEFVASVARSGVEVPLLVRDLEDGVFQILAGHRRAAAAERCGMITLPCVVKRMSDGEALELLLNENLQREDLTPGEEARLIDAMAEEFHLTPEEIAERVSRSVPWVKTRQLLMDLPQEVMDRVNLPKGDDMHVTLGAVEAILEVPDELRKEAVQMVLYPVQEEFSLNERQAREVLRHHLIEPWLAERSWNTNKEGFVKAWKKQLKEEAGKAAVEGLLVAAVEWKDRVAAERTGVDPLWEIPAEEKYPGAPEKLTWMDLARRHGMAVKVVPCTGPESKVVVDAGLLRQAEASREEHGEGPWLRAKTQDLKTQDSREEEKKIEGLVGLLEGGSEPGYEEKEEVKTVIEQGMEHHAFIDMGAVRRVALWAVSGNANPMDAPDFVPRWACRLGVEGLWLEIDQITEWVLGLKAKG